MPIMELPLGAAVKYRGMTGREEDILTNEKKRRTGEFIDEILANCVQEMGTLTDEGFQAADGMKVVQEGDILRLKAPDRTALLLAVRQASYGDEMDMETKCVNCENLFSVNVDLSEAVEHRPVPEDYIEGRGFEVTLAEGTEEEVVVTFDYMNGHGERMVSKQQDAILTAAMRARLKEVSGIHKNDLKNWLLDLPIRLRNQLRNRMAEKDAGPDMSFTFDCPYCSQEHRESLHSSPGFFFPEE